MSNFPSKGVASSPAPPGESAPSMFDRLAKRGYDLILVARNEAGLTASARASSVTRVLGSKSFEPI